MATVRTWSASEIKALRQALRMSVRSFAPYLGVSERTISKWESGQSVPSPDMQAALDTAFRQSDSDARERFAAVVDPNPSQQAAVVPAVSGVTVGIGNGQVGADDEMDALELARRVEASDVGDGVLDRLERMVDELATAYAQTPPQQLLSRVRQPLGYVQQLVDARKTLSQHRRLLVAGGWLSLLAATLHIDLRQRSAATARLTTAMQLAEQSGHAELAAWCLETLAWDVLTEGGYRSAVDLAQQAQRAAPVGSSAHLQATAQEGRAWARMGEPRQTRRALGELTRLVSPLPMPTEPEHHYRYDPNKALSYTATTLAWVGDQAAEEYAREAIHKLEAAADGVRRPRRIASAKLDLSLALLSSGKPDEASGVALAAICSGRIVPSNRWRAAEIVTAVEASGVAESAELRDAYQTYCAS